MCEAKKEERRKESGKHQKKGWWENTSETEQSKNLDEFLADEIAAIKRELTIYNERESKMNVIRKSLILHLCLQFVIKCESNAA